MRKAFAVILLLLTWALLGSAITWVNDGSNGWAIGESVAAEDMNAIKTAVDDNDSRITTLEGTALTSETNSLETLTTGIANTEILIGTGANTANFAAVSGDATLANTGIVTVTSGITRDTESTTECESGGMDSPDNTDRVTPGFPFAITITGIYCTVGGSTPSITLALDECDSAGANCVNGGISATCDGGIDSDTSFTDAAFDANDGWNIDTGTASGTVSYLAWRICYTRQVVE